MLQFINRTRGVARAHGGDDHLNLLELDPALKIIIWSIQASNLKKELRSLRKNKRVDGKSHLGSLSPFLYEQYIIRVGGCNHHNHVNSTQRPNC